MAEPGRLTGLPAQPGQPALVGPQTVRLRAAAAVRDPAFATWSPADREAMAAALPDPMEAKAVRFIGTPAFKALGVRDKLTVVRYLPGFDEMPPMERARQFQRIALPEAEPEDTIEGAAIAALGGGVVADIAEKAVRVPAGIGKAIFKVASFAPGKALGIPTEKVLVPAGILVEKAATAARGLLPESWRAPSSTSTLVNFLTLLPDFGLEVSGSFIRQNIEALDSVGALASLGLTAPAAAAVRKGAQMALAGNVAAGSRVIAQAVRSAAASPVATGKAVARGATELVTGVPARSLPATLGGSIAGPVGSAALRGAAKVGEKITPEGAVRRLSLGFVRPGAGDISAPLRRYAAPVNFQNQIPRADATLTTIGRELFAPIGSTLPANLQPARRVLLAESEQGLRDAVALGKSVAAKNLKSEALVAASQIVEARLPGGAGKRGAQKLAKEFPDAQPLAQEAVRTTNALSRELQAAGFPAQVFQRFKDQYLGRYYLSKELPTETTQALSEMLGKPALGGMTTQDASRLLARKDLPKKLRDQLLEVQNIGYRLLRTTAQEKSLAAFGRFQQKIAKTPGVIAKKAGPGLVQLGDGARMIPALKGKFVPFDVAREIALYDGVVLEYASHNWTHKTMSLWKEVVTVDNPAVWLGNVVTNFMLLDLRRVGGPVSSPVFFAGAARDLVRGGPDLEAARRLGLFDEASQHRNALRSELARYIAEDIQAGTLPGMALQHAATAYHPRWERWLEPVRDAAGAVRRGFQSFYRAQDDIFRYAAFKDGLQRGLTPDAALVRARDMFVDYSTLPMAIRRIGSSPYSLAPFISWQYGIVPSLMRGITENPFALQRWSHALDAWNAAAAMSVGESPDALDRIKEARVQAFDSRAARFFADNMVLVVLPVRTAAGDLMVMDLTRFNPYGTILSGRALSLSPILLAGLEALTETRYYGTTPVGEIAPEEWIPEMARVLAIPPPVIAGIMKIGLAKAAESTDPETRRAYIKIIRLMFGAQGFGSPFGKRADVGTRLLGVAGVRITPTDLEEEQRKGRQRVQSRVEKRISAKQRLDLTQGAFEETLPPIPE